MKKILIILIFFFIFSTMLIHTSTDIDKSQKIKMRDKTDYFMKFRGSVSFVLTYYIALHDGINPGNHIANINYNPLDYTDEGDPDNNHHTETGRILNYTGSEMKLFFKYDFIAPFLATDHFLFSDNNIKFSLMGELSPVSLNGGMEVTITPIAFLYFTAGFLIGPGWNFFNLAGGLGQNGDDGIMEYDFWGPHFQLWFSGTFQMDLAYLFPERFQRWTHIVMYTTPKIKYQKLINNPENIPYMYEADRGENLNGWRYMQESFIGYQINVIEDDTGKNRTFLKMRHNSFTITTGMYINLEKLDLSNYFTSPMNSKDGWGSDFIPVEFGPLIKFDLPYNYWLILFAFFINDRAYTSDTVGNTYYQNRVYEDWYVHFRRIGFFFGWNF